MAKKNKGKNNNDGQQIEPVVMSGKDIEERLLEAGSEEDLDSIHKTLRLEGVPDGSIRAIISRLRSKGKLIFTSAVTEYEGVKPLPLEAIIQTIKLPAVANGHGAIFNAGVEFGMKSLVAAVRLAQELSQMGIAQARPLISMATEMRKAEGMSAQEAGQIAAENALAGAIEYLAQQKPQGKVDIATVPNPLLGIMARAMEPALTQAMNKMFSVFGGQPTPIGGQVQPPVGEQPKQELNLPTGWSMGKKEADKGKEKVDKEEENQ